MTETSKTHKTIYLKDYRPPDYCIETVNLEFDLDETRTRVKSLMTVVCNHDTCEGIHPHALPGDPGYHLHSAELSFRHPKTGREVIIECEPPSLLCLHNE